MWQLAVPIKGLTRYAQRVQTLPRQLQPVASRNQAVSRNVNRSGKVIVHPHPDSKQHQNLITSRVSPV